MSKKDIKGRPISHYARLNESEYGYDVKSSHTPIQKRFIKSVKKELDEKSGVIVRKSVKIEQPTRIIGYKKADFKISNLLAIGASLSPMQMSPSRDDAEQSLMSSISVLENRTE